MGYGLRAPVVVILFVLAVDPPIVITLPRIRRHSLQECRFGVHRQLPREVVTSAQVEELQE